MTSCKAAACCARASHLFLLLHLSSPQQPSHSPLPLPPLSSLPCRLYAGQPFVEFEWTVGPIPFDDGLGREVVVQYLSNLDSGDAFWTDANGREMIKRVR